MICNKASSQTKEMRQGIAFIALLLIGVFLFCSCTSQGEKPLQSSEEMVWPGGKEIPRIRFVGSISRAEDLKITKNFLQSFWDYIVGLEDIRLVAPYGITGDQKGRLYVVDTFLQNIHYFDANSEEFLVFPSDDQPMSSPIAIAVDDSTGLIYVADSKDGIIKVFTGVKDTAPLIIGENILQRPTGIAVNSFSGELLVVDAKLSNIFRFDLQSHKLLGKFGDTGKKRGEFNHPTHITVMEDGTILITDSLNFRIQIYSAKGEFLRTFGSVGDSPGHFARPRGIATDSDKNIYVVDALFDNVQIFDEKGRLLMSFGKSGSNSGEFWLPAGIYIDKNDFIYVADSYNRRIQIFQYLKQDGSQQ